MTEEGAVGDQWLFQSTPPARGATVQCIVNNRKTYISIHAPREGGDLHMQGEAAAMAEFQSTPPARGATSIIRAQNILDDFNPRPPRGGRHVGDMDDASIYPISIHAPREGGDYAHVFLHRWGMISIHAPREGGDSRPRRAGFASLISIHAPREGGDLVAYRRV